MLTCSDIKCVLSTGGGRAVLPHAGHAPVAPRQVGGRAAGGAGPPAGHRPRQGQVPPRLTPQVSTFFLSYSIFSCFFA